MTNSPPSIGFDEAFYLQENPDVLEAVKRGEFRSGLAHFIAHGQYEGRQPYAPECPTDYVFKGAVPPRALRLRVHGTGDLHSFQVVGKIVCDDICAAIGARLELRADSRILDFGCGCGRVITYFRDASAGHLYGTDIDEEAVDWCRENLSEYASFTRNEEWPPLNFQDASFDVIYSVSVFTHLPETMQTSWLAELCRVAKPGSYVLVSIHGETLLPSLSPDDHARFMDTGFLYWSHGRTEGLPNFYQDTFQTDRYVKAHWSRFFEIEAVVKKGVCNHQDLVVCRKPG